MRQVFLAHEDEGLEAAVRQLFPERYQAGQCEVSSGMYDPQCVVCCMLINIVTCQANHMCNSFSGPVSCCRPGGSLETSPRWHATICYAHTSIYLCASLFSIGSYQWSVHTDWKFPSIWYSGEWDAYRQANSSLCLKIQRLNLAQNSSKLENYCICAVAFKKYLVKSNLALGGPKSCTTGEELLTVETLMFKDGLSSWSEVRRLILPGSTMIQIFLNPTFAVLSVHLTI